MVNTSKILTVSYGTFSCTLEGFDDSFETMKAIAEYFRDLAADDRYFGAEPPTPDAEMLARIAEREIARRVDAHEERGKIVLRAAETPAIETPAAPVQETAPAAPPAAPPVPEVAAQAPVGTPDAALTQAAVPPAAFMFNDPVAEEIYEDQAAQPAVEETAEDYTATPDMPAPEESAEDLFEEVAEEPAADPAPEAHDPVDSAKEFFESSAEPDAPAYTAAVPTPAPVAEVDPDSVAAKLNRIRSVVSQSEQSYGQNDYSEDEHAQDFLSETASELDAALAQDDAAELAAAVASEEEADAFNPADETLTTGMDDAVDEEDDGFEDTLSQLLADSIVDPEPDLEPEAEADASEETAEPDTAEDTEMDVAVAEDASAVFAEADEAEEEDLSAIIDDIVDEEDPDTASDTADSDTADAETEEMDASSDDATDPRVIRMTREDLVAAFAKDASTDEASQTGTEEIAEDDTQTSGSADDPQPELDTEGDLTLSEDTNADTGSDDAEDMAEAEPDSEETVELQAPVAQDTVQLEEMPKVVRDGRSKLERTHGQSDIERIFDEADSQLGQPESNQRRSAIQHLRAAVAATRAEKQAGADLKKDVDDTPYRTDLASVVRPRRPSSSEVARSERPATETRAAPLKLVAEQRIDTDRAPIRPRRVSASELAASDDKTDTDTSGSNFSEFAREMGATQLPELLEAAAAYMSDVEGRDQFSRPMLMHKLQEVEKENFSREDGLRSFGQLLREGKIQKIKGGRFTVTAETDFRGEARHAG